MSTPGEGPRGPDLLRDLLIWSRSRPPESLATQGLEPPAAGMFRLIVDLPEETADALDGMVTRNGVTHAEAVRRSIAMEHFIETRLVSGSRMYIEERDGHRLRLLLPGLSSETRDVGSERAVPTGWWSRLFARRTM